MKVKQIRRLFIVLAPLLTSQFTALAQDVNFEMSKTEGCTPMHVVFTSEMPEGAAMLWDFGNGNTSREKNSSSNYTTGEYNVKLIVWNAQGLKMGEATKTVSVFPKPTINFQYSKTRGCDNTNTIHLEPKGRQMTSYVWDFGNGDFSSKKAPSINITSDAYLAVSLKVTDSNNCENVVTKNVHMSYQKTEVKIITSTKKLYCTLPASIKFSCQGVNADSKYRWSFSDGGTDTVAKPQRSFDQSGVYNVRVCVTAANGCTYYDQVKKNIIWLGDIKPSVKTSTLCQPGNVVAEGPRINGTIASTHVNWDFGTETKTGNIVNYRYLDSGLYKIKASVSFSHNCSFEHILSVRVYNEMEPEIKRKVLQKSFCRPFEIQLKDLNHDERNYWTADGKSIKSKDTTIFTGSAGPHYITYPYGEFNQCFVHDTLYIEDREPKFDVEINCKGDRCNIRDYEFSTKQTNGSACRYHWSVENETLSQKSRAAYTFPDIGSYTVKFVATDSFGCSFSKSIRVIVPRKPDAPSINSDVRYKDCPPAQCNFSLTNKDPIPIAAVIWSFGDGSQSTLISPQHFYYKIGTFSVDAEVTFKNGCKSSVSEKDFIKIGGPKAKLSASNLKGCVPLQTQFRLSDFEQIESYILDFGDGTKKEGSTPETIVHYYPTESKMYEPSVIIIDSNGCADNIKAGAVQVYPKIKVLDLESKGMCENGILKCKVKTSKLGSESYTNEWYYDGGYTGKMNEFFKAWPEKGNHVIKVISESTFGCKDTFQKQIKIYSIDAISKKLTDTICLGQPISFTQESVSDIIITSTRWFVNNQLAFEGQKFDSVFLKPGAYGIGFMVTNAAGCRDSIYKQRAVYVGDSSKPNPVNSYLANTLDTDKNEILFESTQTDDFIKYYVWKDGDSPLLIDSIESKNAVSYIDKAKSKTQSDCYRVGIKNLCNLRTDYESLKKHCTIHLSTKPDTNQVSLSWGLYIGRSDIKSYQVFRRDNESQHKLIGSTAWNESSFIDSSTVCHTDYEYKVKAEFFQNDTLYSNSNSSKENPPFKNKIPELYPFLVSLNNNALLEVSYSAYHPKISSDFDSVFIEIAGPNGYTKYDQRSLKTDSIGYYPIKNAKGVYTIKSSFQNECQETSSLSKTCKTIHLSVSLNDDKTPELHWSAYEYWPEDVGRYVIQRRSGDGVFEDIDFVYGHTFVDRNLPTGCLSFLQYRVLAVANASMVGHYKVGSETNSLSNIVAIITKPLVYIPNAFTPDKNGLNETFGAVVSYYKSVSLDVFNGYGQLVYSESKACSVSWDGSYKGEDVQAGVYVYVLQVEGLDSEVYTYSGNLHLLK